MANKSTKRLRLNRIKAMNGYRRAIRKAADQLLTELYDEIYNRMSTSEGKGDIEKMTVEEEKIFKRMVIGYAHAIMDSFGTGSKMDTHYNVGLEEYKNSSLYNPSRKGKTMVGRPKGRYTNFFGEIVTSTGKREGQSVEGIYKPQAPSYAFQRAEIWFFKGNRVNEVLTYHINEYVKGMFQYFEYR